LGTLVAFLTSFYSFRCLFLVFFGNINMPKYIFQNISELSPVMGSSLFFLALGSIFSGYLLKDSFLGIGSTFWNNSIFFSPFYSSGLDFEFIPLFIKNLPLLGSFAGILLAIFFNNLFYKKLLTPSFTKYLILNRHSLFFNKFILYVLNMLSFLHYK